MSQRLLKKTISLEDLICLHCLPVDSFLAAWIKKKMDNYIMLDKGYEESYDVAYMSGCFMLFRSEIYKGIETFEDFFVCIQRIR